VDAAGCVSSYVVLDTSYCVLTATSLESEHLVPARFLARVIPASAEHLKLKIFETEGDDPL
jgi:hypothetical protein